MIAAIKESLGNAKSAGSLSPWDIISYYYLEVLLSFVADPEILRYDHQSVHLNKGTRYFFYLPGAHIEYK